MSRLFMGLRFAAAVLFVASFGSQGGEPAKPASADDAKGWIDLFPGKDLKGWKRVAIAPDTKLNAKNPWTVDEANKLLVCDGIGVKEMLLHDAEFKDGTFHVEWRFHKSTDRLDYNSGIYVRTSPDGTVWHQAQVAHLDKPPFLGDLFGNSLKDGKPDKILVKGRGSKLVKPPGEWNAFDITCKGPVVTIAVNGKPATTWKDCEIPAGHVGMQAEFFMIEFKNLKFKPAD